MGSISQAENAEPAVQLFFSWKFYIFPKACDLPDSDAVY